MSEVSFTAGITFADDHVVTVDVTTIDAAGVNIDLHEVRPEPLIHDLTMVVEAEWEHERCLDPPARRLLDEQPWTLLRPANIVDRDRDVAVGDNPPHLGFEIGERAK